MEQDTVLALFICSGSAVVALLSPAPVTILFVGIVVGCVLMWLGNHFQRH